MLRMQKLQLTSSLALRVLLGQTKMSKFISHHTQEVSKSSQDSVIKSPDSTSTAALLLIMINCLINAIAIITDNLISHH